MDLRKIKSIIELSSNDILSCNSFAERINMICNLLEKESPTTSINDALFGPITRLGDFGERLNVVPLIDALRRSSKTGEKYYSSDNQLNQILKFIYEFVQ